MCAPSPDLCALWLARTFNPQDLEAAALLYHPDAPIVGVDDGHGGTRVARGSDGIRETMAAYIGLKPRMDAITHHTTIAGDLALTRSQWLIKSKEVKGNPGWTCIASCRMAPGHFSSITRSVRTLPGQSRPRQEPTGGLVCFVCRGAATLDN